MKANDYSRRYYAISKKMLQLHYSHSDVCTIYSHGP